MLSGVSIIDDEQDYEYDRSIDKRTVSVLLGPKPARELALGLIAVALIGLLWGTVSGLFPPASILAAGVFAGVTIAVGRGDPTDATALLVRGAYLFFAVLFLAVLVRPFSGVSLPDITVFGQYTYLVTEVVFGLLAVGLLYRAGALRRAARTIVVLYPIAYLWDWYTLEVGVFAIITRTGIDFAGIPLEEHLFMLVVPALIIGVHETIRETTPIKAGTQDRQ